MIQKISATTRWYRKWHARVGIAALVAMALFASTGLLLIWKKNSNGYLLAATRTGSSTHPADWKSLDTISKNAITFLLQHKPDLTTDIDRMDIRYDKGVAKITFKGHYYAVQMDLANGQPLQLEVRRSDFIEQLHDGSIVDRLAGTNFVKLTYGSIAACLLLFLAFSGYFLWYNPQKIRKIKNQT